MDKKLFIFTQYVIFVIIYLSVYPVSLPVRIPSDKFSISDNICLLAVSLIMEQLEVSQIDLSAWSLSPSQEEKDRTALVWHEAFRSHGLLYLTNHGLGSLYQAPDI